MDLQALMANETFSDVQAYVLNTTWQCLDQVSNLRKAEMKRSIATIPLKGIDVPFHSSYLKSGVESFRECLYHHMDKKSLDPAKLIGKYVPNLTAKPFELSRDYFDDVYRLTGSPLLADIVSGVCLSWP